MDIIYYMITFICTAGGCYTGFRAGRVNGVEDFIKFLEANCNSNKEVKMRITENTVEFIK